MNVRYSPPHDLELAGAPHELADLKRNLESGTDLEFSSDSGLRPNKWLQLSRRRTISSAARIGAQLSHISLGAPNAYPSPRGSLALRGGLLPSQLQSAAVPTLQPHSVVNDLYYMGSTESFHYFYHWRYLTAWNYRYRVGASELTLREAFPYTRERERWYWLSWPDRWEEFFGSELEVPGPPRPDGA